MQTFLCIPIPRTYGELLRYAEQQARMLKQQEAIHDIHITRLQEHTIRLEEAQDYRFTLRHDTDKPPCLKCSDMVIKYCSDTEYWCKRFRKYTKIV